MSGTHKYPTISFRISPREREEIEAKIFASGMKKKDYFVRSCIYNRVCVVGKKETVYQIVEKLQEMQSRMEELAEQIKENNNTIRSLTGEYKKIEPDRREGVREQLERMKELCKERNNLYEKQNDLKGQKWKIEKSLER